jgi:hypothetical protein
MPSKEPSVKCVFALLLMMTASISYGHSRLKPGAAINIRGTNPGVKVGPCGGLPRVAPAVLPPGQTITVEWEETIYHPGRFEFYFSTGNDQNFTLLKTVENTQNNQNLPHENSTTLTLPNVSCDACTFQMIQVMLENPASPTNYYSCSDMQLKAGATMPTTTPTPTPTPAPTTAPVDNCVVH